MGRALDKGHPGCLQRAGMSGAVETGKAIEIIPPGVSQPS